MLSNTSGERVACCDSKKLSTASIEVIPTSHKKNNRNGYVQQ